MKMRARIHYVFSIILKINSVVKPISSSYLSRISCTISLTFIAVSLSSQIYRPEATSSSNCSNMRARAIVQIYTLILIPQNQQIYFGIPHLFASIPFRFENNYQIFDMRISNKSAKYLLYYY